MPRLQLRLENDREVRRALERLPARLQRRAIRATLRKAARKWLQRAKRLAPVESGTLRKSLGIKVKSDRRRGLGYAVVGPRRGQKRPVDGRMVDPARYAHLVEFGAAPHVIRPRDGGGLSIGEDVVPFVHHPGTKGTRFLTRAYEQAKGEVLRKFQDEIGTEVKRAAKQLAAKR